MGKSLTGLALLLAGALSWAYLLTHPLGDAPPSDLVEVWKVAPRRIERITFRNENVSVVLEPNWEKGDTPYVWIRTERERRPSRQRGKPPGKSEKTPEAKIVKSGFKGNAQSGKVLRDFAALQAGRVIGKREALDAGEFGLDKPQGTLRLERKGDDPPLELTLGALTYGKHMRYALSARDENVYLFRQALFAKLMRANQSLYDRALFSVPPQQALRIRIIKGGTERWFWRQEGAPAGAPAWAESPDDAHGNPAFENFMAGLKRLQVVDYLPQQGEESEVAALEIHVYPKREGGEADWLRLFPDGKGGTIARSSHTKTRVKLSNRMSRAVLEAAERVLEEAPPEGTQREQGG
jgi:hypothetical protein